ncbi:TonB-dependent receptor plug domain-containing protein [Duganella sp. FT92W]|uniref:TonB-dependent receptor plug domain-containing protein n=1 Tax=Pseudoduganella rivuli TaxID=2666085 RepID=A0A7X2ISD3_9BURK|nr:TonB-dependent receptor [Pseudoduganella rivuli]MRV75220.1 TonB-dependent receptor plug domain-containing protein [Pseudoduganella rivuli]
MMNHPRLRLTQIALSLSIALAAAPSFAQNTTSAIGGRISGADGKPAAGATVTIVHNESGSVSNVTTDADGRYVARGLRVGGPYTITITKNGVSEKREDVYTNLAETSSVDATLGAPAAIQTVTIAGVAGGRSEKFSKTSMGAGTSVSATELAIQGSINRNLQDYARSDPRVSQTDKERGEMSVAGQNSRYNSLTIDGVSVNDTFGLEASGSPTSKQPISIEAIQSVQVNVANYDVTQKGYTGGNINAVTKSGTNKVKGSVYYVFRNDSLAGERFNSTNNTYFDPAPFRETTKGFTLGAPLIKDKLFIFANYEKLQSTRTAPAFGPIGSDKTNVGVTTGAIAAATQIAKDRYGLDIGTSEVPAGTKLDVTDKLVKLDWNVNDDHRVMVRYAKTEQADPIFPLLSATGVSLNSTWYSQEKAIETKVAQWTADWTPNFSTELKFSQRNYDSVPRVNSQMPLVGLQFSGALPAGAPAGLSTGNRFINFGTENSRQRNILGTKTDDVYLGANWSHGDHEIKFGGDYQNNKIYNAFLQNVYGNYTFACLPNIGYKTVTGFATDAAIPDCSKLTAAQHEQAVLENFSRGRPLSYQTQIANAGKTMEDAVAKFSMKNTGLFLQDTWTVNQRLTLNGGVRIDMNTMDDRPLANAAVLAPTVARTTATGRQTGGYGLDNTNTFDGQKLWQPRVGFNYQFDSARPMQLRGGAGLFQGAAATVWVSNAFSNPGVVTKTVGCGISGYSACNNAAGQPAIFSPDINNQPTFSGTPPAANVDILAPGLRQPSVWKANIAFDHELPWYGVVFAAEFLKLDVKDGIYYQNLNLGAPTRMGSDGRELYYTDQAYLQACWNATGGSITSGATCTGLRAKSGSNSAFNNVILAQKTSKGGSNLMTLSLSRPLTAGFGWSVAYTYTEAKEVSPLTSSTSNSNWSGRSVFNPNEEVNANSSYLVKDRINAVVNFQKKFFGTYNTRFGLFYEGRSGKPYSWTINNDLNGDGLAGNDLMYIPSAPGSGEVVFKGDTATNHANEDKFWSIVNQNGVLKRAAGKVVERNSDFAPWTNSFDVRVAQEIPSFFNGHKATFTLDIFNVGNLINKKWGRINEVGFQSAGAQARSFVDYAGMQDGKYVYQLRDKVEDLNVRQEKGESQWAIQATLKYEF